MTDLNAFDSDSDIDDVAEGDTLINDMYNDPKYVFKHHQSKMDRDYGGDGVAE